MNAKIRTNAKDEKATLEWLLATGRGGVRRVERLGWKRLAGGRRRSRAPSPGPRAAT